MKRNRRRRMFFFGETKDHSPLETKFFLNNLKTVSKIISQAHSVLEQKRQFALD
jgi:hypothetical protein